MSFQDYTEDGPTLFKDAARHINARFRFTNTNVTIANTLRRAIETLTPSVAFRTEPYEKSDVNITVNTTPLVNEMLAHRIGMLPINIRDITTFTPDQYEFTLDVKNETKATLDVRAADIKVFQKNLENPLLPPVQLSTADFFPPDPITGDTVLITRLRPQWNPTAPVEQIVLKARASLSSGTENIRYSPVACSSYEYTRDPNEEHQNTVFQNWLLINKKIADSTALPDGQLAPLRREFDTMEIQRCYLKDERGNAYDFTFNLESVGVQPIPMIVESALAACIALVSKYIDIDTVLPDTIRILQADARYPAIDIFFTNEGHTLGNLLETHIVDNHIDGTAQPAVNYVAYKVPHPLRPEMFIRIGVQTTDDEKDVEAQKNIARNTIATAARTLKEHFRGLLESWKALHAVEGPK